MGYYVGQAPPMLLQEQREIRHEPIDSSKVSSVKKNKGCSYCGYAGNREGSCPKCGASE